jgi:hypothetical protein
MQPITLAAKSNLPACAGRTCTCTETVNDDKWGWTSAMLELQWTLIDEKKDSLFAKEVGVETTSVLFISQRVVKTLDLNHTYTIQVEAGAWTGFITNNIERFATVATVRLMVQPVPPVVRIKFGNRNSQWGFGNLQKRLVLDASESWDPDNRPGDPRLIYFWFLDCSSMFLKLPQYIKDRAGWNRKTYLTACEGTVLSSKILSAANKVQKLPTTNLYGADVLDTFQYTELDEGIPITDLLAINPYGSQLPNTNWAIEINIGVRLTDIDGASANDTVSIMLTDKVCICALVSDHSVTQSTTIRNLKNSPYFN